MQILEERGRNRCSRGGGKEETGSNTKETQVGRRGRKERHNWAGGSRDGQLTRWRKEGDAQVGRRRTGEEGYPLVAVIHQDGVHNKVNYLVIKFNWHLSS